MRRVARVHHPLLVCLALLASAAPALAQNDDGGRVIIRDANRLIRPLDRPAPPASISVPMSLPPDDVLDSVVVDPEVQHLVARLGDASYAEREVAMRMLSDLRVDVNQLCAVLTDERLSPEQRYRLVLLLRRSLLGAPRGAVGIRMRPGPALPDGSPPGVLVEEVIEGLPAVGVLQPGDRITHIDDVSIRMQGDLQILVQSKAPGTVIDLRVRRPRVDKQGRRVTGPNGLPVFDQLDLDLALGSADRLIDPSTGLPTGASAVRSMRTREAEDAWRRYAPKPQHVDLTETRPEGVATPTTETQHAQFVQMITRAVQLEIDRMDDRRIPMSASRRSELVNLVRTARDLSRVPELSDQDREALRRLADRLEEKFGR